MDNSQSSDIFSDKHVNRKVSPIDILSYEELVLKIKTIASQNFSAETSKLSNNFSTLLHDCSKCVLQGLDILVFLLEDSSSQIDKLCCYLENAICILQIISKLIKNIESMAVSFCTMKTFSTTTGNIILSVFSHCKDSECTYGRHIRTVEKQLKDLFRNCHELQLTYLMALEKHYIFDLTETEQQDILMETLDINLKIGELVQALDVKTMAEQWKAYTMICEKYSSFLFDKNTFNKTTKLLAEIIHNHVETPIEVNEDDKFLLRSLKVASFSLKILLQICKIFKCASNNNYEHIVKLLQEILLYNSSYYKETNMSSKIINYINTYLLIPSEAIITHLVTEENFIKNINSIDISLKESRLLDYVLLLQSVMKASLSHKDMHEVNLNIINMVISVLPYCHTYFNMGFTCKNDGLFECLLIHTLSVCTSLDSQHYTNLEHILYEAILSTDHLCAIFCSNLWVLLCRLSTSELHLNTLINLIGTYQRLETNALFLFSPQHINLSFTIENLFKTLKYPEKLNLYKQLSVYQEKNDSLWCILKIRNLPENLQMSAKKVVSQKVISLLELLDTKHFNEHLQDMIQVIKLASTCEFLESDSKIESLLVQGWSKVCPSANQLTLQTDLDVHSLLYYRYLEALSSLTESYYDKIEDHSVLVRILHVISSTLRLGNIEIIKLLFKIFCKFMVFQERKNINNIVIDTLKYLLERNDIELYIYSVIISNEEFNNYFMQMLVEENLKEASNNYIEYKSTFSDNNEWLQRLELTAYNRYSHKCIQNTTNVPDIPEIEKYDDIESVDFELDELEYQLVNKKRKYTNIENIIDRLESEVSQLGQLKDIISEEYKTRIRHMCDNLRKLL